jgi:peptidoglycan/LPS O-acetylase OafA/YrhL
MNRIPGLDLLRALAIVWVMLFHSFLVGGLGAGFDWLSRFGWAGVDMFFVFSGFLIGTQVLRPLQRGAGLSIRLLRTPGLAHPARVCRGAGAVCVVPCAA